MVQRTSFPSPKLVHIIVYEEGKVFCELDCDEVIEIEEHTDEDAEMYEEDFYDAGMVADRFGEYITLHFLSGESMTYRKNEVNISWS